MRGMRGFLIVASAIYLGVGVIRGVVVVIVSHVPLVARFELTALNVVLALVWLPVTVLALRIGESTVTPRRRAVAFVALGIASILVETWLTAILRYAGAPIPSFV